MAKKTETETTEAPEEQSEEQPQPRPASRLRGTDLLRPVETSSDASSQTESAG